MPTDKQGNPVSGATAESVALFDQAVRAFNIYRGDPVALLTQAIDVAPDFAMARIAKAHLFAVATEPAAMAEARGIIAEVKALRLNDRESSHVAALDRLFEGEWKAAALALDRHNVRFPHDIVALQSGHLLDFFCANARNLRDRIARVLPKWSPDLPGYAVVLGMYTFGLEECGDYGHAEHEGRRALSIEPLDCWAHHAVAHVMEMQGRSEDGIGWMLARERFWSGDDNFFKVHNWWHRALFHLDLGQKDEALALYDEPVRESRSAVAVDLVDASSLLWRLHLLGFELGDRWQELSKTWDQHADGKTYPFNDWHAVMAFLGAERNRDVERVLSDFRNAAAASTEVSRWAREIGLPLVEGFVAFWRGDYETAVERLYPARLIVNGFGGSHAQRDIIDWTLTEAALRGRLEDIAEALANERIALKPHSRVNLDFLRRVQGGNAPRMQLV